MSISGETGMVLVTGKERPLLRPEAASTEARFESASLHQFKGSLVGGLREVTLPSTEEGYPLSGGESTSGTGTAGEVGSSPTLPAFKFQKTFCSSCGREFGPGNHGFSHCEDHA